MTAGLSGSAVIFSDFLVKQEQMFLFLFVQIYKVLKRVRMSIEIIFKMIYNTPKEQMFVQNRG